MKLLVNAPTGLQELIEVGDGGGYFDPARVLWDERDDGPLPEITRGGMVRVGGALTFDQERMDEHIGASALTVTEYMAAVQKHLDAVAVSFGYDHILAVISYAEESSVPRYQAEGIKFRAWRSIVWSACEGMLAAVMGGQRTAPTVAELLAELPPAPAGGRNA